MTNTTEPRFTVRRFAFLGISDDVETCDCCGRTGLKRTVALARLDRDGNTEEVVRYGTGCAAHALRVSVDKVVKTATAAQAHYEAKAEQTARFARILGRIDAALADAEARGYNHVRAYRDLLNATDEDAAAAIRTAQSLVNLPFADLDTPAIIQARNWYAKHSTAA